MDDLIRQRRRSRVVPMLVLALALGILGATILYGTARLRRSLREQMVNHDGEMLHAVAQAQQLSAEGQTNPGARLSDRSEQLALALQLSQLRAGVIAVRIFDASGKFITAFPPYVAEAELSGDTLQRLNAFHPVSRYEPKADLAKLFLSRDLAGVSSNNTPLVEVNIPIHQHGAAVWLGAAQLVLDARGLETEFRKLDEQLARQSGLAFLVSGSLLAATLFWAYRRLEKSNELLRERTARLLHANHELSLTAKTGALGAVTAHLVHGLSNPLANLQEFVARGAGAAEDEWQDAAAAARRMQELVREVVRVLGEEGGSDRYELSFGELAGILSTKSRPKAREAGVQLAVNSNAEGVITNRHANLVLLILENLVANAIQVTPRNRMVRVNFSRVSGHMLCRVSDEGPGFPPNLRETIFSPCRSTQGGSGLGLAISRQLAIQLGAKLELTRSSQGGCVFELDLPLSVLTGNRAELPVIALAGTAHGGQTPN